MFNDGIRSPMPVSPVMSGCSFIRNIGNRGGGLAITWEDTEPWLINCRFFGNTARVRGGGLYNDNNSHPTILSGDLNGDDEPNFLNYDENSYHVVTGVDVPTMTIFDGLTITGGHAPGIDFFGSYGAGVHLQDARLEVRNCTFTRNLAERPERNAAWSGGGGAALFLYEGHCDKLSTPPLLRVSNSRFQDNSSNGDGGAVIIWNSTPEEGSVLFSECTFERNVGRGALTVYYGGTSALRSCVFSDNSSQGPGAAVFAFSAADVLIEDVRFERNSAGWGGAIVIDGGGTVTISGSTFVDNSATAGYAGALRVYGAYGVELVDSSFQRNSADYAGAVWLDTYGPVMVRRCEFFNNRAQEAGGGLLVKGSALVEGCTFTQNYASEGGGLCDRGSRLTVADTTFQSNGALLGGGVWTASDIGAEFERCRFRQNYAYVGGGVAALGAADSLFERCEFTYNVATIGGGLSTLDSVGGAGLWSCLFTANTANAYGGGIAAGPGALGVANCTIAQNRAEGLGAGLIAGDETFIVNSIVWGNVTDPGGEAWNDEVAQIEGIEFAVIQYSSVQGWSGAYGGEGNIGVDPLFVEPVDPDGPSGSKEHDFHLLPESPCINAGLTETIGWVPWAVPPPNLDLDGKPRVLCGLVDLGAYELGLMGDVDCNFSVDLDDFSLWSQCAMGPGAPGLCFALDADGDGDNDLRDFARFQLVFGR